MKRDWQALIQVTLLIAALLGLALGGVLHLIGATDAARVAWAVGTIVVLVPTVIEFVQGLLQREAGVDFIAVIAMVGALVLGENLAGAIIALMLTGGTALERFAVSRARRELSALLRRAPRTAHRRSGADLVDVDVDDVRVGDLLVVKPGEVVPADGILTSDSAVLDESECLAVVLVELENHLPQGRHQRRVDTGTRLIQQHDGTFDHQRACKFEELLLAAGQVGGIFVPQRFKARDLQNLESTCVDVSLFIPHAARCEEQRHEILTLLALWGEHQIFQHRQAAELPRQLECPDHAPTGPLIGRKLGDVFTEEMHGAGLRLDDAGDQVEDCGLARAIGSDSVR